MIYIKWNIDFLYSALYRKIAGSLTSIGLMLFNAVPPRHLGHYFWQRGTQHVAQQAAFNECETTLTSPPVTFLCQDTTFAPRFFCLYLCGYQRTTRGRLAAKCCWEYFATKEDSSENLVRNGTTICGSLIFFFFWWAIWEWLPVRLGLRRETALNRLPMIRCRTCAASRLQKLENSICAHKPRDSKRKRAKKKFGCVFFDLFSVRGAAQLALLPSFASRDNWFAIINYSLE